MADDIGPGTIVYQRGTQWAEIQGRAWALGEDYDRLWWALTEIAKHDSSEYSDEHRRLVALARRALSPSAGASHTGVSTDG